MLRDQKLYESPIQDYAHLLAGKRVFITTAARGIGKSIAILFARQGADIYFAGRNEEYVRGTEEQLQAIRPACRGYVCNLADAEQSEKIAQEVLRDSGGVDVLVCSVGVNCHCPAAEFQDADMMRLLETNYIRGLRFARAFIPGMRQRRWGSVINISSIHSVMTQPTNMLYAGTKGAMNAAARAMALDYAKDNIRVNTICPGVIVSDVFYDDIDKMTPEQYAKFDRDIHHCQPLEPGKMPDIANAALYFASDMSSYVTGQYLLVDGGTSVMAHDNPPDM